MSNSIFNQQTDLLGGKKEIWMIHDLESFNVWLHWQPIWYKSRIENVTVRDKQGGLSKAQKEHFLKFGTLPYTKITREDMYAQWLDNIKSNVLYAINDGSLEKAVNDGRLTASDARTLIEAAGAAMPASLIEVN